MCSTSVEIKLCASFTVCLMVSKWVSESTHTQINNIWALKCSSNSSRISSHEIHVVVLCLFPFRLIAFCYKFILYLFSFESIGVGRLNGGGGGYGFNQLNIILFPLYVNSIDRKSFHSRKRIDVKNMCMFVVAFHRPYLIFRVFTQNMFARCSCVYTNKKIVPQLQHIDKKKEESWRVFNWLGKCYCCCCISFFALVPKYRLFKGIEKLLSVAVWKTFTQRAAENFFCINKSTTEQLVLMTAYWLTLVDLCVAYLFIGIVVTKLSIRPICLLTLFIARIRRNYFPSPHPQNLRISCDIDWICWFFVFLNKQFFNDVFSCHWLHAIQF